MIIILEVLTTLERTGKLSKFDVKSQRSCCELEMDFLLQEEHLMQRKIEL